MGILSVGIKNMKYIIKEKIKMKGVITIRQYRAGTLDKVLPLIKAGRKDEAREILHRNIIAKPIVQSNVIITAANLGTDLIIQALNGYSVAPAYPIAITYGAIGTGSATPTSVDTQLTAEVARSLVSYSQDVAYNELQLQFFFSDGLLPNQTYYEFGAFMGGSATPNSGQLFDHALFASPYAKTSGVDTTIELDITI
jgi:hypothetical protein